MGWRDERGFTLIELLVVVAIMSILAGLISVSLVAARRRADVQNVHMELQRLAAALDSYQVEFGDYPPTDMETFYEAEGFSYAGNGLNSGIESVVAHLATRSGTGPYFEFDEERLANLDGDEITDGALLDRLNWIFGGAELREYLDPWGTPYIYVHNRDYESSFAIIHNGGKRGTASAGSSEKTETFHAPTTFQLWSAGRNRINENGAGDDIGSW